MRRMEHALQLTKREGPFQVEAHKDERALRSLLFHFSMRAVLILVLFGAVGGLAQRRLPVAAARSTPTFYKSAILADKPVAYWPLGRAEGTTVHDIAGRNDAASVGDPTFHVAGIAGDRGGAVRLRGGDTSDSIQAPPSASLDIQQGTLEVWFKANNVTSDQKILMLHTGVSHTDKFILGIAGGQFYPSITTSGGVYATPVGAVTAGTWYHFIVTYDPDDRFFRVYVNGRQLASVATDGNPLVSNGQARATIGGWADTGFWFDGVVEAAAVYNVPLTAAQIQTHYRAGSYLFGTLLTCGDPPIPDCRGRVSQEYSSGIRVVELELRWSAYEPSEGNFDKRYIAGVKTELQAFQAAGMKVVLGAGLQYPPDWVFTYPNSHYVDQFGDTDPAVNLTFNQPLRDQADAYLTRLNADLGLSNFWAVRIGSGGFIESNYPSEQGANAYWAFDDNAQGRADDRPATIPASPFPGWKPGQTTWSGQPFTTAQVQQWYDWYLGALMDGINWQAAEYEGLGFTGLQQVLLSGIGSRPDEFATAIQHYLDGTGDDNQTMGRGAVWNRVVDDLTDRQNVVIYISSVADGSGGNDVCQPGDISVAMGDPQVDNWSATRWISYNADRYGLLTMGENPGKGDASDYGFGMLQAAAQQTQGCGLQGLMWAHDYNLYGDGASPPLNGGRASYASIMARYPH